MRRSMEQERSTERYKAAATGFYKHLTVLSMSGTIHILRNREVKRDQSRGLEQQSSNRFTAYQHAAWKHEQVNRRDTENINGFDMSKLQNTMQISCTNRNNGL